jgi:hypothetical protein
MNDQTETVKVMELTLKALENNNKIFFDAYKQLEYKAYINITLSALFLTIVIDAISKVNYNNQKIIIVVFGIVTVFLILTISIIMYSYKSLTSFQITDLLYENPINENTVNDSLRLMEHLLKERYNKTKGLVNTYNNKIDNLHWSTLLLHLEMGSILGVIVGMLLSSLIVL